MGRWWGGAHQQRRGGDHGEQSLQWAVGAELGLYSEDKHSTLQDALD